MKAILYVVCLLLFSSLVVAQEWTNDLRVTSTPAPTQDPAAVRDPQDQVLHVVTVEGDVRNIVYLRIDPSGSLIDARQVSATTGEAKQPAIVLDSQRNKHIVWADANDVNGMYRVLYSKLDASNNVVVDRRVIADAAVTDSPQVVVDNQNNAHVIWGDFRNNNWELYYEKIAADGSTIVDDRRLTNAMGTSFKPTIAVDNTNNLIHVAFEENRDFDIEVYYIHLDLNGNVLVETRVTNTRGRSLSPSIAGDASGNAYIVFSDYRIGNYPELYLAKVSRQGAVVFERQMTSELGWPLQSSLVVAGNNVLIVWQDHRDGNAEIYYQKRDIDGNPVRELRLTNNPANSAGPVIVGDAQALYVLWQDFRDGNWELYHKRTTSPPRVQQGIIIKGKPQIGSTIRFGIQGPASAQYVAALSRSLGNSFGLGQDDVFTTSVNNPTAIGLENSRNVFGKNSEAVVTLAIANRRGLIGQTYYFNYAVIEQGQLRSITEPVAFTLLA